MKNYAQDEFGKKLSQNGDFFDIDRHMITCPEDVFSFLEEGATVGSNTTYWKFTYKQDTKELFWHFLVADCLRESNARRLDDLVTEKFM